MKKNKQTQYSKPIFFRFTLQLGLSVLTNRPRGRVKTSLGGKGIDPRETVKLLESVNIIAPKGHPFSNNCHSNILLFRIF